MDLKQQGLIIHRYQFPEDVASKGTNYLNKIVIDDAFGGYAYITDNSGSDPGIIVYSRRLNRSWKVRENNSMRAALNAVAFAVNGTNLNFSIHIDGLALGPYINSNLASPISSSPNGITNESFERNVYYCPLSSYHLYSLPASLLRDPEFALRASSREVLEAVTDHGVKIAQTDGMIMDNHGILYYSLLKEHAIAQWDSYKPFTLQNQNIIAKDNTFIQWIDGMGFDDEGNLYAVMNRLHNFVARRLNPNEINFRILKARTGTLSYVYTDISNNNIGPNIADTNLYSLNDEFLNNNGISSTLPTYSSLGSIGRSYYSSASFNSNNFVIIFVLSLFSLVHLIKKVF